MIKYQLLCDDDHEFEGWFRDSADFDIQASDGLVECPVCGNDAVRKAVMAPAIARSGARRGGHSAAQSEKAVQLGRDLASAAERARDYVQKNFDYVGEKFPEEARKIHYGETKDRSIYGEASGKDVRDLITEGVQVAPLPGAVKKTDRAGAPKIAADVKKLN